MVNLTINGSRFLISTSNNFTHWFEIFNKKDDVGNELNPGLGIGLALVQKLTQIMGGALLTSCQNQEICFRIKIPVFDSKDVIKPLNPPNKLYLNRD